MRNFGFITRRSRELTHSLFGEWCKETFSGAKKSDLVSNNKGERHEVTAGACPRGIEGGFPLLLEVKEPEGSLWIFGSFLFIRKELPVWAAWAHKRKLPIWMRARIRAECLKKTAFYTQRTVILVSSKTQRGSFFWSFFFNIFQKFYIYRHKCCIFPDRIENGIFLEGI